MNLYAESDKPQQFFTIACICIALLTVLIACSVGYVGYLAFGATTKSIILYNLPNDDPLSITAKCCYVLTIAGSFVLLINPIFYIMENANWYKGKKKEETPEPKEGEDQPAEEEDDEKFTCCSWLKFVSLRSLIVYTLAGISFLIPNIHILLTFGGAILGTIVNIYLPVFFYNRAYNSK